MTLCFSDIETREAMRRLKEVSMTFGFYSTIEKHMEVDSDVASDVTVLKEFLGLLRCRESKRQQWHRHSPQLRYRKFLVDFVMRLCTTENLSSETTYQAIYLVDRFMDQHDIVVHQLGLVATVCVSLSGKLLETDNRTPRYKQMVHYLKEFVPYATVKSLAELEGYILDAFHFDILVPTEFNFLEVYLLYIVDGMSVIADETNNNYLMMPNENIHSRDDNNNNNIETETDQIQPNTRRLVPFHAVPGAVTLKEMTEMAMMILEHIARLGEPNNKFKPSQTAAAIILAARREHGLNFWTDTLETVTSYNLDNVYHCLKEYVEPILSKLMLKQPFDPPYFLNYTFESCFILDNSDEQEI